MSSNIVIKEKLVKTILGDDIGKLMFDKIKSENDSLKKISDKYVKQTTYDVANYIETVHLSDYTILQKKSLREIKDLWGNWIHDYKINFNTKDYIEKNKILIDWRKNGIGFYWVDLEKEYCVDSQLRMNDCGRVNYGDTTIELREQTETENLSWVIIVYDTITHNIRQIKGKNNQKPNREHWEHILNFMLNTDYIINAYIPQFKSENDLKMEDFDVTTRNQIKKKHPNLFMIKSKI